MSRRYYKHTITYDTNFGHDNTINIYQIVDNVTDCQAFYDEYKRAISLEGTDDYIYKLQLLIAGEQHKDIITESISKLEYEAAIGLI